MIQNFHPNQQVETDKNGTLRFRENAIVRDLLDKGDISLNDIVQQDYSKEDYIQLMQLIGYSVSGWGGLNCVIGTNLEEEIYTQIEDGICEKDAKIAILERQLRVTKKYIKEIAVELFPIHPDTLDGE